MASLNANSNLHKAKNAKKDEFYTQLEDIEKELRHYAHLTLNQRFPIRIGRQHGTHIV